MQIRNLIIQLEKTNACNYLVPWGYKAKYEKFIGLFWFRWNLTFTIKPRGMR